MAYESNYITMIGNLTDDPELRFTQGGHAVTNFRLASNRRWTGKDGQQQEETTFVTVNAWRELAENVAETFHKGDRAIVIGRLRIREYDKSDGTRGWSTEIEADEIAPSLRWASAKIVKSDRGDGNRGGGSSDLPPPPDDSDVPF